MAKRSIARIDAHNVCINSIDRVKSKLTIRGVNSKGTETKTTVIISDYELIQLVKDAGIIARNRVQDANYISKRIIGAIEPSEK